MLCAGLGKFAAEPEIKPYQLSAGMREEQRVGSDSLLAKNFD